MNRLPPRGPLTNATARDADFANVGISGTLLVRGKQFSQDHESVELTVLDLTTVNDLVVTGNTEIDGTLLCSGAVSFDAPVSFNAATIIPVNKTSLTPAHGLTGTITLQRQINLVDVSFTLTNADTNPLEPGAKVCEVPEGCAPSASIPFMGADPVSRDTIINFLLDFTSTITYQGSTAWRQGETRTGHICYLI